MIATTKTKAIITLHVPKKYKQTILNEINKKGKVVLVPIEIDVEETGIELICNDNVLLFKKEKDTNIEDNKIQGQDIQAYSQAVAKTVEGQNTEILTYKSEKEIENIIQGQDSILITDKSSEDKSEQVHLSKNESKLTKQSYTCKPCNISYSAFGSYKTHVLKTHVKTNIQQNNNTEKLTENNINTQNICNGCNKVLSNKYALKRHQDKYCRNNQDNVSNTTNAISISAITALTELLKAASTATDLNILNNLSSNIK
jgi:hypothetical protein